MQEVKRLQLDIGGVSVESRQVFSYPLHTHAYYEMLLYEPFEGEVLVNHVGYRIDTPTVLLVCPTDLHEIHVKGESKALYTKLEFDVQVLAQGLLTQGAPAVSLLLTDAPRFPFLLSTFREILSHREDTSYVKCLINALVCALEAHGTPIRPLDSSRGYALALLATKHVHEHLTEPLTLVSVAHALSVAPAYLSTMFKQSLGVSFSHYVSDMRLHYAANLITSSQSSITEICFAVGFGNFSHFSKCFKRRFGLAPRAYREQARGAVL